MKLTIDITGKDSKIEQISTYTIANFYIRMQMGGKKGTEVKTFAVDNAVILSRMGQDDKRSCPYGYSWAMESVVVMEYAAG